MGLGSLKVVREVFVCGKTWLAVAGQTVDFRDQELLSRIERFIEPERGTDPHAFELACRLTSFSARAAGSIV